MGLRLTATAAIDLAAAAGFGGVDLLVADLVQAGEDPAALGARMEDRGLRGGAWPLPVTWRGDRERFENDLARLPRFAEAAAILGLGRTGTWVLPETPDRPGSEREVDGYLRRIEAFHVDRLGSVGRVLERFGTRLGLEVIGVESFRSGRGLPFVHQLAQLDQRLGSLWSAIPNLGIVVDAFHLYAADEPVEVAMGWGVDRVVWVHVADIPAPGVPDRRAIQDADRGLPGETDTVDVRGLLHRLAEAGYNGPVTVEPLGGCRSLQGLPVEAAIRKVATSLRTVWPAAAPW